MRRGPEFNPVSGGWHADEDTSNADKIDAAHLAERSNARLLAADVPDWPAVDDPALDPRGLTRASQLILASDMAAAQRAGGQRLYHVVPGPLLRRLP
jgi:hypothetical protein